MNITDIAYKINEIAANGNHEFNRIQEIRGNNMHINPLSKKPFASFGIKDRYAFHAGGRKEFQFNIGEEPINGKKVFRYGMAFSLYQDKTLHDPKADFRPLVNRFNKFLKGNPEFFKGFKMWYHVEHELGDVFNEVRPVDKELFQAENFIFLGKYFNKRIDQISVSDIEKIVDLFDYLLPLYKYVQFGISQNEKRIARICWNDKDWLFPSGQEGKSKNIDTHEAKHGYGHEEWIFDTGKQIDSYHYGFLEPIGKQHQAFENKCYDVWLYTINNKTKQRYWIGEIKNLEVIDRTTSEEIKKEYIRKGWFKEMEQQIKRSGANSDGFSNWKGVDLFNVRYLPSNLMVNSPYYELPSDHPVRGLSRYAFAFYKEEFNLTEALEEETTIEPSGKMPPEDKDGKVKKKKYRREEKAIEITFLHEAISKSLTAELKKEYGLKKVEREYNMQNGSKIDIVVWDNEDIIFYEIKTYPSLKASIREAIGQLMEYSLWTNQKRAQKLVVVTQPCLNFTQAKRYFQFLRDTYDLPIYYQSYDYENKILSELV